jgi:hypothetical protein
LRHDIINELAIPNEIVEPIAVREQLELNRPRQPLMPAIIYNEHHARHAVERVRVPDKDAQHYVGAVQNK